MKNGDRKDKQTDLSEGKHNDQEELGKGKAFYFSFN